MGVFETRRTYPYAGDLNPVADDVIGHFERQGFQAKAEPTSTGLHLSISKGGMFKAVCGLKTALKLELDRVGGALEAKAGIGIFGMQAVPTFLTLFVAWPVVLPQIWGLVKQAGLDDEALNCVETSIQLHTAPASGGNGANAATGVFCTRCGARMPLGAKFCGACGASLGD
jgi:hypothetical protein